MQKKSFNQKVWEITKRIPKGKVSTYKEIAKALGTKAYRVVGHALHVNPYAPVVPCHRVINSDGSIGGFASGPENKIEMLRQEKVIIKNKKIELKKFLYRF